MCNNEQALAVISGKVLIKNEQQPNQLDVFMMEGKGFKHKTKLDLGRIEKFQSVTMDFYFNTDDDSPTLIFAKQDSIITLNFENGEVETMYQFKDRLHIQPQFLTMNEEQDVMIIASEKDGIYINLKQKVEIDIDAEYGIESLKKIIYDADDQSFFVLANHYKSTLGIYLVKFYENDPFHNQFVIRWNTFLDIGNISVFIMRNEQLRYKELVIGYCSIFVNTHNIIVMDISEIKNNNMVFRHESY